MSKKPTAVALIPARAGSKRVPDKNIRPVAGHPVLAYTIAAALESQVFEAVMISTDSPRYAEAARHYGAEAPFLRPAQFAGELSPDVGWVEHALQELEKAGRRFDCFSILRPTSPFRQAETIRRAWNQFLSCEGIDSLRAVEKCKQHPGKMWVVRGRHMTPLMPLTPVEQPWHSSQYQALPEVYVQNASLEIAWTRVVAEGRTIAGNVLTPFLTQGYEGFDVNQPEDWERMLRLVETGEAKLPAIAGPAWREPRAAA